MGLPDSRPEAHRRSLVTLSPGTCVFARRGRLPLSRPRTETSAQLRGRMLRGGKGTTTPSGEGLRHAEPSDDEPPAHPDHSFPDDARANDLLREIQAAGFSPVCIYRSGPDRTVRVGEFKTTMDAQLAMNDLGDSGYEGLRIRYNSLAEEQEIGRRE